MGSAIEVEDSLVYSLLSLSDVSITNVLWDDALVHRFNETLIGQ